MAEPDTTPEPTNLSLLAKKTFGANFHGEVKEPVVNEPVVEDVADDEPEDVEREDVSHEEIDHEPDPQPEPEGEAIGSLPELIEHYELDPEWANTLKVPVKVDGQASEATLADLVANYQMDGAAKKRLDDAKAKAAEIVAGAQKQAESVQAEFAVAAKLLERVEAQIDADSKAINWSALKADDPAEYAAKRMEFNERRDELARMKQDAAAEYQKAVQGRSEQGRQQQMEYLQQQQEMLLEAIPEWKDPGKADAEKAAVTDYLIGIGFSRDDVSAASDHRLIVMAREACLYRQGMAKGDAAKKKVAKVPKVLKPGAPKSPDHHSQEHIRKLEQRFKKTRSPEDAAALKMAQAKLRRQ